MFSTLKEPGVPGGVELRSPRRAHSFPAPAPPVFQTGREQVHRSPALG